MSEEANAQVQPKKKMSGCLIAIIVVVVVIFALIIVLGIVAAVAIPGFEQYVNDSKSFEAKDTLNGMSHGATAYYQMEHETESGEVISEMYPVANTPVLIGPEKPAIGMKNIPTDYKLDEGVWKDLRVMINRPFYYTYSYVSDGKSYVIKAYASLNQECDSIFIVKGKEGEGSNILDISETHDCSPAKLTD